MMPFMVKGRPSDRVALMLVVLGLMAAAILPTCLVLQLMGVLR